MWEVERPRTDHQDFGGRLSYVGPLTTALGPHGVNVAGVIAGSGSFRSTSIGMSFEADVVCDDANGALAETAALGLDDQRVHNHSYGYGVGWGVGTFSWNGYDLTFWDGDLNISETESPSFGIYESDAHEMDETVTDLPYTLPVYSAGNHANDSMTNSNGDLITVILGGVSQGLDSFVTTYNGELGVYDASLQRFWRPSVGSMSTHSAAKPDPEFTVTTAAASTTFGSAINNEDGGVDGFDSIPLGAQIAKNVLTVGAVDNSNNLADFSSRGPADDGRIKPDVVAGGVSVTTADGASTSSYATVSGTSFSAPCLAGGINLLAQAQESLWGADEPLWASTYKALVIHTATDLGNPGPDYSFGWGLFNADEAMGRIWDNFHDGDANDQTRPCIKEIVLKNNEVCEFTVGKLGSWTNPMWATIAWSDPEAVADSDDDHDVRTSKLVNDIELRLIALDSSGNPLASRLPYVLNVNSPGNNATSGANTTDNVEQVRPPAETITAYKVQIYQIFPSTITDDGSGGQRISIILSQSYIPAYNLQITNASYSSSGGQTEATLTWDSVVGQLYMIEFSSDLITWGDALTAPVLSIKDSTTATSDPVTGSYFRVTPIAPDPF